MKKIVPFSFLFLLYGNPIFCQRIDVDVLGGIINYQGDFQKSALTLKFAKPAATLIFKYGLSPNFFARLGLVYGSIGGDDKNNSGDLKSRNLNFKTNVQEAHLALEYRFLPLQNVPAVPYVFGGIGLFSFNPYTTYNGSKVFLQPIGTEGQGLAAYPTKKMYRLTQYNVPFGGGIKWQVSNGFAFGVEFSSRILFTDYIDDVSGTYADEKVLLAGRGQIGVDLAYRRPEIDPTKPYPAEGQGRGGVKRNDNYYLVGATLGISINNGDGGVGGTKSYRYKNRASVGCPTNVF